MPGYSSNISSVYSLTNELSNSELKPIYFLYGEDHFTINAAIKKISKKVEPLISTDFDTEMISVEKKANLSELLDLAYTFPFGSEKKMLIVKNFENYSNKKVLVDYINSPSETTILIIANFGSLNNINSEPFKSLSKKQFIFEARELKGAELENWLKKRSNQLGFELSGDNAKTVIEIVGEDKSLLEMQLQKFSSFLGDKKELDVNDIKNLSSKTKEYSIFDLLNSLGKGNSSDSFKVLNNLLDTGKDLLFVTNMLTKYFTVISQSLELQQRKFSDADASKAIGVSKYYYYNCKNAIFFKDQKKLKNACKAIYNADLGMKTSGTDQKILASLLITEIFA